MTSLTSGERLREDLGGEGGLGARTRRAALLVLLLTQHVSPAAVQEAVEDVRGDDVRQRGRRLRREGRLQAQRRAGQDRAHHGGPRDRKDRKDRENRENRENQKDREDRENQKDREDREDPEPRVELRKQLNWKSSGTKLKCSGLNQT